MLSSAGMIIDGFRLDERLHRGGMADIWRVSRSDIDLPVISEVPFLDFESDIALLVGFEVEQMIMAWLEWPACAALIANGDYAVQPYRHGVAFTRRFRTCSDRPLSADDVVQFGIALATAVSDLHEQHVLHLDLKPANVLFPFVNPVRPCSSTSACPVTSSFPTSWKSSSIGRPGRRNTAPEQLLRVRSDRRSDIFALGVILYELVTGRPPFGAPAHEAGSAGAYGETQMPPRALAPRTPPALQESPWKCLEPVPDARYKDAADFLFDLRHLDLVVTPQRAVRTEQSTFAAALAAGSGPARP